MKRATAEIKGKDLVIHLAEPLNMDHTETVAGNTDRFWVDYDVADTRQVTDKQRRLFFALMGDIGRWSGEEPEWLRKYYFYPLFAERMLKPVSLSSESDSSVSDINTLIDMVIDFIFEYNVPINSAYSLLPRDEEHFIYQCCRHRECLICSEHADIHHIDSVGIGGNRKHVDHTKRHVMPLCRIHHQEYHTLGPTAFSRKYHVPVTGIKLDVETLRKIGVQGDYSEAK